MRQETQLLDTFGVPEFFATHIGAMEDAGNGMMRVIHCIERHGVMIPVFSAIRPATAILKSGPPLRELAMQIVAQKGPLRAV